MDQAIAVFYDKKKAEKWTNELNKLLIDSGRNYRVDCFYTAICCPAGGYFEIYLEKNHEEVK